MRKALKTLINKNVLPKNYATNIIKLQKTDTHTQTHANPHTLFHAG